MCGTDPFVPPLIAISVSRHYRNGMQRRKILGLLGSLVGVLAISCRHVPSEIQSSTLERFEFEQPQMGVPFRMVLFAPDESIASGAAIAAFDRIKDLNAIMSDYEADSELSELSRSAGQGRAVRVSADLWRVLERSQQLAQQTEGAFDITVGPYVALWRRSRRVRQLPDPERLEEVRPAVGYRNIVLNGRDHTVQLLVPGMKLDLGGIAKGYAVDEAMKVLRSRGITRALVGGVGDIVVGEPPPGKSGWRIALAQFDRTGAPTNRHVLLRNAAISTSGDAAQRLEIDGRKALPYRESSNGCRPDRP